ncbi:LacI family DNA-binding transcriptional regulator [Herbiconiux sp. A18JL235]|uniref:LacI family DNA-binding transcriptional regulator n=1 Tax=Herbiconiux sp. A18JL235 TaxID=3152363 RepID=A0AB39BD82_9MICO
MSQDGGSTIRDVAERAGVSIATVSNLINGTKFVSPELADRIEAAIVDLGFVPNRAVRTLRGMRMRVIGLVVPDALNPYFIELWRNVQRAVGDRGYVVVLCDTGGDLAAEQTQLRSLAEMRVQGVLITSVDDSRVDLRALRSAGAKVVLLGDPKAGSGASSINIDQRSSGYLAMQHLLEIGRRNVVFAGGPRARHLLEDRMDGAQAAIDDSGLADVTFTRIDSDDPSRFEENAHVASILAEAPHTDGVICANDVIAIGLMENFLRRGIRVPDDIAIVGHDDIRFGADSIVRLSTIRQPIAEIADRACELLLSDDDRAEADHLVLDVELVRRESS